MAAPSDGTMPVRACDSYEIWVNLLWTTTKVYFPTSKTRVSILPPNHQTLIWWGEKNLGHNRKNQKPINSYPGVSPLRATSLMDDPRMKNSSTTSSRSSRTRVAGPVRKHIRANSAQYTLTTVDKRKMPRKPLEPFATIL